MKRTASSLIIFMIFSGLLVLLAAACGSDGSDTAAGGDTSGVDTTIGSTGETPGPSAASLEPGDLVFVWEENGGCLQGGPNCARYEVSADGTVNTYRTGEEGGSAEVTGTVSTDVVEAWNAAVEATDIEALTGRLGPGEMTAAFDGVDFELRAPYAEIELSSVDVEFDETEPFFAAAVDLARAAYDAAPLPIQMR